MLTITFDRDAVNELLADAHLTHGRLQIVVEDNGDVKTRPDEDAWGPPIAGAVAVARRAGYVCTSACLEHHTFEAGCTEHVGAVSA